ncbi:MAG: hypothetical protein A2Y17_04265 [Clostridiales bacterium GWF2_38_85]|nr:MAG: hypothetical protein A2Y17_04265 [Clostridiales bacterium GWF2_38_85]HBL83434.1 hypothetical protein [Clostridiales bacterium]
MYIYPVSLRYEITKAQLLIKKIPSEVKVETEKNGYQMKRHPAEMKIDNTDFFESIGIKSPEKVLEDAAVYGKQAVLKGMARRSEEKNAMLGPDGMTVAEIAAQRSYRTIQSTLDFIPKSRPEISWEEGYVDINYTKDQRNVTWTPPEIKFEYIPYSVEIYVDKWSDELEQVKKPHKNDWQLW